MADEMKVIIGVGTFTVNEKKYKTTKRYIAYCFRRKAVMESDDRDLPRSEWGLCEVVPAGGVALDNNR